MALCFVIGPIGSKFAPLGSPEREAYESALEVYERVILPACEEHDLQPIRADQIAKSGEIPEQVFRHLFEDPVVIADVSGGNPNVMYELGLRHTRNLLTIQIGEFGQLPFDVAAIRTIQFSRSERGLIDARKQLERALRVGLSEGLEPITPTRVWLGESPLPDRDDQHNQDLPSATDIDEVEPDGLLERMATVEEKFPDLTAHVEAIGETLQTLTAEAEESTREFSMLNASGAAAQARLAAVKRFANKLDAPSASLEAAVRDYVTDMNEIDSAVNGILAFLEANPEQVDESVAGFLTTIAELATSMREGMEMLGGFGDTVLGLGQLSRSLRQPGRRINRAISDMAAASAVVDEWERKGNKILHRVEVGAADGGAVGEA